MIKRNVVNIVILVVAVVAVALGAYFYYQLRTLKTDLTVAAKKETENLIFNVSRLYLLPVGEEPTIATVSDPEILKNQSFFIKSEKGDKVLIFNKAGKAILYRPSIDKIIEVAPISNTKTGGSISTPSTTPNTGTKKQ